MRWKRQKRNVSSSHPGSKPQSPFFTSRTHSTVQNLKRGEPANTSYSGRYCKLEVLASLPRMEGEMVYMKIRAASVRQWIFRLRFVVLCGIGIRFREGVREEGGSLGGLAE